MKRYSPTSFPASQNSRYCLLGSSSFACRRGVLAAWSIWIILSAGLIVAALFNVLWMSGIRAEARRCLDSAAISAGHSYLSDDLLRSSQQPFEHEGRTARCKDAAVSMADQYRRHAALPRLSTQNVNLTWPAPVSVLHNTTTLVPVRIAVSYAGNDDGFRLPQFFSGLTGRSDKKLSVGSSVSIERAPCAFRPDSRTPVPVLPFAIKDDPIEGSDDASARSAGHWTASVESSSGRDDYSWNNVLHQFERGPDGLPEISVTLYSGLSTGADAFVPVSFGAAATDQSSSGIVDWIHSGLTDSDLQTLGLRELTIPGSLPACSVSSQLIGSIAVALQSRVGEPFLICLCSASDAGSQSRVNLTRSVAARVVLVKSSVDNNLKITLQPCILVTSTAITSTEPLLVENRYVYSVRLCE